MQENADQKNSGYGYFSRSVVIISTLFPFFQVYLIFLVFSGLNFKEGFPIYEFQIAKYGFFWSIIPTFIVFWQWNGCLWENTLSNRVEALTKSMNMGIWVVDTLNQLIIRGL